MKVGRVVFAAGFASALMSLGFLLRWPIVTQTWPVAVTPLTYTFLSAYVLGSAVVLIWIGATGELHGLAAFGLTTTTAFGAMAAVLVVVSVPLILRTPDVMPWDLDLESGALIGCLFLGSAAYFAFGALRPRWPDAAGPLAALLAYDVVLTVPLITHYPVARPPHVMVLVLYIAVLVSSAILGVHVFLLDRRTRLGTTSGS